MFYTLKGSRSELNWEGQKLISTYVDDHAFSKESAMALKSTAAQINSSNNK